MLSPGDPPIEDYINMADNVCVFEDTYSNYQTWSAPSYCKKYPATKFTHIIHTAGTTSRMIRALKLTASRNAGYVFVTNDILSNPYDTMPSYWSSEVTAFKGGCK
jgi:hypothetical protein